MKKVIVFFAAMIAFIFFSFAKPYDLRVEYMSSPINLDTASPRLSWKNKAGVESQSAYRIIVSDESKKVIWDSGKVNSSDQLWIEYKGAPLKSFSNYSWTVETWANEKSLGASDAAMFSTAALDSAKDFSAQWIQAPRQGSDTDNTFKDYKRKTKQSDQAPYTQIPAGEAAEKWVSLGIRASGKHVNKDQISWQTDRLSEIQPAPMFRKDFNVSKKIKDAKAYICGLGLSELYVNGNKIGNHTWDPAETSYDKRVMYLSFDVTKNLNSGKNAIGVILGNGWYNETTGFSNPKLWSYGYPILFFQMNIVYEDGSCESIVSDSSWLATLNSPIVKNGVWCGELYDATLEIKDWNKPNFKPDSKWGAASVAKAPAPILMAQNIETIDEVEETLVKEILNEEEGSALIDMGRIISGYFELKVKNQPKGTILTLIPGQSLNADLKTVNVKDGTSVGTTPIDIYVCKGEAVETWKPQFTFHAFRYVQIDGLKGKVDKDILKGYFTTNKMKQVGTFECSLPLFNKLHKAIVRTSDSNTRHKFTDTPSRERTGWMTWPNVLSIYDNYDSYQFFKKWIADARTNTGIGFVGDQFYYAVKKKNPDLKPQDLEGFDNNTAGMEFKNVGPGMAPGRRGSMHPEQRISNIMYPYETYMRYGDVKILKDHYQVMKNTVDFLSHWKSEGLIPTAVGDWHDAVKSDLNIAARAKAGAYRSDTWGFVGGGYPVNTPGRVCGTVHTWLASDALSKTAKILGNKEDAAKYKKLAEELVEAYNKHYYKGDGNYAYTVKNDSKSHESQAIYAYSIYHDFLKKDEAEKATEKFMKHIASADGHFTTGQLATDKVVKALSKMGREQEAFNIMTIKGFPSFDYMLSFGTETTWETWGEAILKAGQKEGTHFVGSNRPQEHCEFTGVDSWFYEFVMGLIPLAPAYKAFQLKPHQYNQLEWANASYESPYGKIVGNWKRDGKKFTWKISVPSNSSAEVYVPSKDGKVEIAKGKDKSKQNKFDGKYLHMSLKAGDYEFVSNLK